MIYKYILSSVKRDDVAVRWLITLILNIKELETKFGKKIENILGIELKSADYLQRNTNERVNKAIQDNISRVNDFMDEEYDNKTTISCKMTDIINKLFDKDMNKKNKFVEKSVIESKFDEKEINFEEVTEVCYFYKEDDQFVILLNGSNTGKSVEVEIITEKVRITKIDQKLSNLLEEKSKN